jgi:hypothetical protein
MSVRRKSKSPPTFKPSGKEVMSVLRKFKFPPTFFKLSGKEVRVVLLNLNLLLLHP